MKALGNMTTHSFEIPTRDGRTRLTGQVDLPDIGGAARHPVVVVGAGPIGLAASIDLAEQDVPVVVLYENDAGRAVFEYDRPSLLFGQFGDERVTAVARELDASLERVLVKAVS